jgi:hypothetical protein
MPISIHEGKQVGLIYHFTTSNSIKKLLNTEHMNSFGCDILTFISHNDYISTTRNFMLAAEVFNNDFPSKTYNIRITFNGDIISDIYKIHPIAGATVNTPSITNINIKRVPRSTGEYEEVICPNNKPFSLKKYVTEIYVFYRNDDDILLKDEIQKMINNSGLPIKVNGGRKFTNTN